MSINNNWFTLVEVMIATIIISITVFWVLRLSNTNSNQVTIVEKNKEIFDIFQNTKACIKSFWINYLKNVSAKESINFWKNNNTCQTWSYDINNSFSWVVLKNYYGITESNPNEYFIYYTATSLGSWVQIKENISNTEINKDFDFVILK